MLSRQFFKYAHVLASQYAFGTMGEWGGLVRSASWRIDTSFDP